VYARGELRIIGRLHRDSVAACDAAHDPEGQPVLLITGLVPATDAELAAYTRWAWRLANCSRHPYIADVVCHGVTDRRPYLGVRTGQRRTLAEWLARHRRLPYQQVRLLGSALAEALATAHGAGLCHLAVRPEVIYLDEEASPVLTGFDAGAPVLVRPMATGSLSAPEFHVAGSAPVALWWVLRPTCTPCAPRSTWRSAGALRWLARTPRGWIRVAPPFICPAYLECPVAYWMYCGTAWPDTRHTVPPRRD